MNIPKLEDLNVVTAGWEQDLTIFPGCTLIAPIAKGGFGEVWKAHWLPIGEIALKKVHLKDPHRNESRALRILAGIRHESLASIHGFRREGEFLVVALELGDETLEERLSICQGEGRRGIPVEELREYMRQIADALDFLYRELKVVHRDVKPSNLLRFGTRAKVCDFGLAKVLQAALDQHSGVASFDFAPPEFFEGKTAATSDQFSLAVSYVYLLTGMRPFPGPSVRQLMMQHLVAKPELAGVPESERVALQRALARDPQARFPTCTDFVQALTESGP
ncbi:MAG: serine/threonine-protein kinase [Planctomycetota bacterium]